MSVIPTEIIYDDAEYVSRSRLGLRTWNALAAGTATEMYLWAANTGGIGSSARAVFNIRKNGVPLFPSSQRFEITLSVLYAAKIGLSIPVIFGDEFSLDLERASRIVVYTPITFLMRTQE